MNFLKKLFRRKGTSVSNLDAPLEAEVDACLHRASEFRFEGQYQHAIDECSKALSLQPTNSVAYHLRSLCRYATGDREGAFADWKRYQSLREIK